MKGIILAGGSGTRLYPITYAQSKQLLPIYNKPMIYYAISTLMEAGIRDILLISTPRDLPNFETLLGSGDQWGVQFQYSVQEEPRGLADAFIVGKDFVAREPAALILGDNLFYGGRLSMHLAKAQNRCHGRGGATVFAYKVSDPERYGVVQFDDGGKAVSIVEKPTRSLSRWAVTGLYFYDEQITDIAANIQPSARGELEITDVNQHYLNQGNLHVETLSSGYAWLDTGTHDSLLEAGEFVRVIEKRQGTMIGSPELAAFRQGYITVDEVLKLADTLQKTSYGQTLRCVAESEG